MAKSKDTGINPTTLDALVAGVARLVAGQCRFAEELGLHIGRVFPEADDTWQAQDHHQQILAWLQQEAEGIEHIEQLFSALVEHQLALVAALDGVALQALKTLAPHVASLHSWLRQLMVVRPARSQLQELQNNQQLRYQTLITPGFVDNYIRVREGPRSNDENKGESL